MSTFVLDGRTMQDHYWGIGRYVFHLAHSLAEIAPQENFRVLYDPRAQNTRFEFSRLQDLANLQLVPLPINARAPMEQMIAWKRELLRDAALYHAPYYALPYALEIPLVVTLADVTPLVIPGEMPNRAKRMMYRALNRLAARRAKQIITFSLAARADLINYLPAPPQKITVVPLAAYENFAPASAQEIERVRAELDLPPRYLLYLGINKPHKNVLRLCQAFAQVQTDARLVIAGHWDARFPEAKNYVATNQFQEKILFRHDIAEANLAPLLSGATAFVFPSTHEGFGLPPLEAMACGTPVVCSNASALPKVVGDAALTFNPSDTQEIAAALARALEDATLRDELKQKGFVQANKFSWERTARETLRVYRKVTDENSPHL